MRGANQVRRPVSVPCDQRQTALQDARRFEGIRRVPRQYERPSARWLHKGGIGPAGRAPSARLASDPTHDVLVGSVAVYDRLKPRDSVDAMFCTQLVALQNAIMSLFAEAAISRDGDQCLKQAYAGLATLREAVATRENRVALKGDARRKEVLNELMRRYGSLPPKNSGPEALRAP